MAANPTIIGTNTTYAPAGVGSQSFSHTVPSTGQNRALIVLIQEEAAVASTVTWDGNAMTKIASWTAVSFGHLGVWYLANPTIGTLTVAATKASGASSYLAFTLQDVAQSSPLDQSHGQGNDTQVTSFTNTATAPAADSLTIHWFALRDAHSGLTLGTGETELQAGFTDTNSATNYSSYEVAEDVMEASWTTASAYESLNFSVKYLAPTVTNSNFLSFM